jgi:adenosylcobinamide-phosphate synthase
MRWRRRAAGASAGVLADRWFGEPPIEPHPVAVFGSVMGAVEQARYRDDRGAGLLYTAIGAGLGATAGAVLRSTAAATYLAVAGHALGQAAHEVAEPLLLGDLDRARAELPALVGRDATQLDAHEIARAVVESVAENTTDAVVAAAFWAVVAGAPGVLAYRAVNTMDAMVGHRSARYARFGWASARLDDVANWVPARLTAALVALARPARTAAIWAAVRDDAPGHPSPNSGVAEAAFAAALGVRLGGTNVYGERIEHRPALGQGRHPEPGDIAAAVRLADDVAVLLAVLLGALAVLRRPRIRRP